MIKIIVFDIDGVITDGSVMVDSQGREMKRINMKDVDAVYALKKKGYKIAAITGEKTEIVSYFQNRFPWDYFYDGNKQKAKTLREIAEKEQIAMEEICYIGDGKYDVQPLFEAGLGICPKDAIDEAKAAAHIILQGKSGEGCLWELMDILEAYKEESSTHYFYKRLDEHILLFKYLASDQTLIECILNMAEEMLNVFKKGKRIFLCGNGGSAADAQHIAAEFVSRFYKERPAMDAEALTVNTSALTAIGNDYSFERVFVRQLEAKGNAGDLLIGLSTSGASKNVLEALRYAKKSGIITVMLMGNFPNRELEELCDYIIKVPSEVTPRIQEAHIFLGHLLAEYVEEFMFREEMK